MTITLFVTATGLAQYTLGYPIFVRAERDRCTFQIQDMIMSRKSDVRDWMKNLQDKDRQIDIVWLYKSDKACIAKARMIVRKAGYSRIVVRNGKGMDYPSGLPPFNN
jgi:hypothetical protein